jgi:carboxymethylenebutenolidase
MKIDISQPPPPLRVPNPTIYSPGITLLPPLSRRGTGPGLILLTPSYKNHLSIINGVPSLLRKWAEEGYTVTEIQSHALPQNPSPEAVKLVLDEAISAMNHCIECQPRGKIGIVGK